MKIKSNHFSDLFMLPFLLIHIFLMYYVIKTSNVYLNLFSHLYCELFEYQCLVYWTFHAGNFSFYTDNTSVRSLSPLTLTFNANIPTHPIFNQPFLNALLFFIFQCSSGGSFSPLYLATQSYTSCTHRQLVSTCCGCWWGCCQLLQHGILSVGRLCTIKWKPLLLL